MEAKFNPLIFVLGPTGRGKSTSIRTLPKEKTVIFNFEDKPLPFKGQHEFDVKYINSTNQFWTELDALFHSVTREIVVIDSLTSWLEILQRECEIKTKKESNKHAKWTLYADIVWQTFKKLKEIQKAVFIVGHPEITQGVEGEQVKTLKISGQWKGSLEKEALIVLYAVAKKENDKDTEYFFATQTDGTTPAKSPLEMFEDFYIPNDLGYVLKQIYSYYGLIESNEVIPVIEEKTETETEKELENKTEVENVSKSLGNAIALIKKTTSVQEIQEVWDNNIEIQSVPAFIEAVKKQNEKISAAKEKQSKKKPKI